MFDLRILNLIAFGLLALAFVVSASKLDKSRALNRQLETALQEKQSVERSYSDTVEQAKQFFLAKEK